MVRYAIVRGLGVTRSRVTAYLPGDYKVIYECRLPRWDGDTDTDRYDNAVVIAGRDSKHGGFGLDGYIIPRLGSGMMRCDEIDLSHPVMKEIPV